MLTAQTISNKWLAIVLTNGEKPKKSLTKEKQKALEEKKSAPTAGRVSISLGPIACVYVSLSFFHLASPGRLAAQNLNVFSTPASNAGLAEPRELMNGDTTTEIKTFFFFAAKKACNNNKTISGRIRNLFYNWQICSPLGWNSFARCF